MTTTEAERLLADSSVLPPGWHCKPNPGDSLTELLEARGVRAYETSGSRTGVPAIWWRSPAQLTREADVTIAALPGGIDRVITTVAPTSVYGFTLGILVPLALGIPVRHQELLLRDLGLEPGHTLVVTVAPGWCTGPALPPAPAGCQVTFVHAGSMLPPRARSLVDASQRSCLVELFGATETGLLATRAHVYGVGANCDPWTVVDDVDLVVPDTRAGEVPLTVRSARIGSTKRDEKPADEIVLGDWIMPLEPRKFRFDGRRERLVKPGGRPVDLDFLEAQIGMLTGFELRLACVPAFDPTVGELVVLEVEGSLRLARDVEAVLRAAADALPVRPRVVAVNHIVRSPMGKPRPMRLAA